MKFIPLEINEYRDPLKNIYNPLRNLSIPFAEQLLDSYRTGRISNLELIFDVVEEENHTLQMCIDRRGSAVKNNDWTIKNRDAKKRKIDTVLQQEQYDFLVEQFMQAEDSGTLFPAIDKLAHAVFNGLGVVQPIYGRYGLERFEVYDAWNFAISPRLDKYCQPILYWNPNGVDTLDFERSLQRIPSEQVVANVCKPIDRFALLATLAEALGVESYNSLIARRGLPATYIIASEDTSADDLKPWAANAVKAAQGGSGAFPFGTNIITEKIDANNANAIRDYLEWLQKQIVLAATGGSLQSLTEATGLGSNVADQQAEVFKSIVRADCSKIGDLINRGVARRLLDAKFPGRPHLVYFDLLGEEKAAPEKYLQDAVLAKNAGLKIDLGQLSEMTGYKLAEENVETAVLPKYVEEWSPRRDVANEEPQDVETPVEAEESEPETSLNAEEPEEEMPDEDTPQEKHGFSLLKAFDKMLNPLRALFVRLLHSKSKEEEEELTRQINEEIERLESTDDTEYQMAVQNLLKDEFEAQAKKDLEQDKQ